MTADYVPDYVREAIAAAVAANVAWRAPNVQADNQRRHAAQAVAQRTTAAVHKAVDAWLNDLIHAAEAGKREQ